MNPQLTFEEDSHVYRVDGVRLPSVTEILKYHNLTPNYPSGDYRVRGKQVHKATQLWDEGYEVKVGPKLEGYLESYRAVLHEWHFEWDKIETLSFHPTLLFAGTIDRSGKRRGTKRRCIADLKSGDTGEETELQLAGYALLEQPSLPAGLERYRIRLFDDGTPGKVREYTNSFAFEAFVGYLNTYKWEQKGK